MKGMIFAVKPFEIHDGDGIRTTVFLKGCPLRCVWCHNPESFERKPQLAFSAMRCVSCGICTAVCPTGSRQIKDGHNILIRDTCSVCGKCVSVCIQKALCLYGEETEAREVLGRLLPDKWLFSSSGGGVTLSGGEPLLQPLFCRELLSLLKNEGIPTAVDTCGCVPWEALEAVLPYTDAFLYDIKAVDEDVHIRCTGVSNRQILENLTRLDKTGKDIEVRIPLVPGYNTGEIPAMACVLAEIKHLVRVRILPYHAFAKDKYEGLSMPFRTEDVRPPDGADCERAVSVLRQKGINAVFSDAL